MPFPWQLRKLIFLYPPAACFIDPLFSDALVIDVPEIDVLEILSNSIVNDAQFSVRANEKLFLSIGCLIRTSWRSGRYSLCIYLTVL